MKNNNSRPRKTHWKTQHLAHLAVQAQLHQRLAYVPKPIPPMTGFTPNVSRVSRLAPPTDRNRLGGDWSEN